MADGFYLDIVGLGLYMIIYIYIDVLGCQSSCSFEVMVNVVFEVACFDLVIVCIDIFVFLFEGVIFEGGMYSGVGVENGFFYLEFGGIGVYVIIYEFFDSNMCSLVCIFIIEVVLLLQVSCMDLFVVCVEGAFVLLVGGLLAGGNYIGFGVVNGVFDFVVVGFGVYLFIYIYISDEGCVSICIFDVLVNLVFVVICLLD